MVAGRRDLLRRAPARRDSRPVADRRGPSALAAAPAAATPLPQGRGRR